MSTPIPIKAIFSDVVGVLYSHADMDDDMLQLFDEIQDRYKTGIITSITRATLGDMIPSQYQSVFDVLILNSEVGMAKPDPRMFVYAAKELGLEPEECVFVDDTAVNVDGAVKAGMHGIVFTNRQDFIRELAHLGIRVPFKGGL